MRSLFFTEIHLENLMTRIAKLINPAFKVFESEHFNRQAVKEETGTLHNSNKILYGDGYNDNQSGNNKSVNHRCDAGLLHIMEAGV